MVSGFEKRMLSGMFGLLSVDCAKAGEVAPTTASVTAPATTRLRESRSKFAAKLRRKMSQPYIIASAILVTRILPDTLARHDPDHPPTEPRRQSAGWPLSRG